MGVQGRLLLLLAPVLHIGQASREVLVGTKQLTLPCQVEFQFREGK